MRTCGNCGMPLWDDDHRVRYCERCRYIELRDGEAQARHDRDVPRGYA